MEDIILQEQEQYDLLVKVHRELWEIQSNKRYQQELETFYQESEAKGLCKIVHLDEVPDRKTRYKLERDHRNCVLFLQVSPNITVFDDINCGDYYPIHDLPFCKFFHIFRFSIESFLYLPKRLIKIVLQYAQYAPGDDVTLQVDAKPRTMIVPKYPGFPISFAEHLKSKNFKLYWYYYTTRDQDLVAKLN
jgi:hypothetical protein